MHGLLCLGGRIRSAVGRSCSGYRLACVRPFAVRERSALSYPGYSTTGTFAGVRGIAMKILVIGHRGMLAQELLSCLASADFAGLGGGRPEVDITQATSVRQTLAATQPDILINAAAYTAVDQAETEPDVAFAVNRDGVAHLAEACRDIGIPLLHVSTDYVFDGSASRPFCEDDRAAPLGVYGRSKW